MRHLGEQVARVLSGRRLDEAARAQVVRLIDARAQQLVPGAVRRVVGSWTAATLGAKKPESAGERRVARGCEECWRTAKCCEEREIAGERDGAAGFAGKSGLPEVER